MKKRKIGFKIYPKTIYSDIPNLPATVYLGITIKGRNYDEVTLYFQLVAYHPDWTFTTANLGAVGSGAEIIRHLHNYGYRSRPTAEVTNDCEFTLKAYTDEAYTNLKWESKRTITIVFIKSDDGTWTLDEFNNFDDGTLQGWGARFVSGPSGTWIGIGIAEDYAISVPYSAKMFYVPPDAGYTIVEMYKSFTTPDKPEVYAIMNLRYDDESYYGELREIWIMRDGVVLNKIGTPDIRMPRRYWKRFVVPLPRNTTLELKIRYGSYLGMYEDAWVWLDDFKLVSR